jgi:hypothetical protein
MQEIKSIYFCSVNTIVLELLALDYRLADAVLTQNGFVLCDSYERRIGQVKISGTSGHVNKKSVERNRYSLI